jgi:small-conductance mechanosensitive channel
MTVLLLLALAAAAPMPDADAHATPHQTFQLFLDLEAAGKADQAGALLEGSPKNPEEAARQLAFVLRQQQPVKWAKLSDDPEGDPSDGRDRDIIGQVRLGEELVPVVLVRRNGSWLVGKETVARVDALYATFGPPQFVERLPALFWKERVFGVAAWQAVGLLIALAFALIVGLGIAALVHRIAMRLAKRTESHWDDELFKASHPPFRALVTLGIFGWALTPLRLASSTEVALENIRRPLLVIALSWLAMRALDSIVRSLESHLSKEDVKNRGVRTQLLVFRQVTDVLIGVVAVALVLSEFEAARAFGVSLLASAGIAGIVLGLAAQKSIAMLLGGIQLSITQPIRIGDTVVVDGEYGTIEEIDLSYVVVKAWDHRRLVVPVTRFLEQSFQNWTKVTPEILGPVELRADYSVPVDALRAELQRLCEGNPNWDKRVCRLVVTEAGEKTLTLRALVSSSDPDKSFELRYQIRESMIAFLQKLDGGTHLPQTRVQGDIGRAKPKPE